LVIPYAEVDAGVSLADRNMHYYSSDNNGKRTSLKASTLLAGGLGAAIMPWRHLGVFGQGGYRYAPVPSNNFGESYNSGGLYILGGLRGAL